MRLIDADAADVERICCYYGDNCRIEDVLEWLDDQPTVDAVPVVRCKDCIHAIKFRSGQVSCGYHDWCRVQVDPNGYCNHGEKDE